MFSPTISSGLPRRSIAGPDRDFPLSAPSGPASLSTEDHVMNVQFRPEFKTTRRRLPFDCVALVLQGGGALGAYQAGVYEALAEANVMPDWIAGISIGSINSALIAGNAPEERVEKLRAFWESVTIPAPVNTSSLIRGDAARGVTNQLYAFLALTVGVPNF